MLSSLPGRAPQVQPAAVFPTSVLFPPGQNVAKVAPTGMQTFLLFFGNTQDELMHFILC